MPIQIIKPKAQQSGFSMLEVLVSVVIISVGLLGLAGLQAASLKSNSSAYERSQATILANDILERMQSNITGVYNGKYNDLDLNPTTPLTAPACFTSPPATGCGSDDMAKLDTYQWAAALAATLPSGTGLVTNGLDTDVDGEDKQYIVIVSWDDRTGTGAGSTNKCAFGTSAELTTAVKDDILARISADKYCILMSSQF